ncbi:tyrosine-protein kinase csk-1-like, partial [Electrophorus electricus]|uniref:tyrosine-protein kinase csk-1-like n=1 Tax=Electrophorus electricus TaxID=8005 RepID=UPI0015CF886D
SHCVPWSCLSEGHVLSCTNPYSQTGTKYPFLLSTQKTAAGPFGDQQQRFNKADVTLHQLIKAGRVGIFYKAKTTHSTIKGHDHFICKISRSTNHKQIEKEISIMQKLGKHRNLLQLVDWDIMNIPYMLIMEYVNQGTLLHFLQVNKDSLCKDSKLQHQFTIVAYQIAHAMNHLHSKMVVHCDLVLRNIMVHNFPHEVKVSGISQAGPADTRSPAGNKFPFDGTHQNISKIKTMDSKGMSAFGILIWEMQTFGSSVPYRHLKTSEDVALYVSDGCRNSLPEECRAEILKQ